MRFHGGTPDHRAVSENPVGSRIFERTIEVRFLDRLRAKKAFTVREDPGGGRFFHFRNVRKNTGRKNPASLWTQKLRNIFIR